MSKDSGGILKIALLAGGGYFLYQYLSTAGTVAGTSSTGTPATSGLSLADIVAAVKASISTPTTPATGTQTAAPSGQGLAAELQNAAKDNAFLPAGFDAYQWNWYRNQLHPPELTTAQFGAAFANPTAKITAADFVAALQGAGLSGLGAVPVVLPVVLSLGGQRVLVMPRGVPPRREVNAEAANHYYSRRRG